MSSQHKAPLAAFFVVSIACIVVVVNALRSDAIAGIFVRPSQAVIAGARLVPEPQDILAVEAKIIVRAHAALSAGPTVAHEVVDAPVRGSGAKHHKARVGIQGSAAGSHTSAVSAAPVAAAPPVAAEPTVPVKHPAPVGHTSHAPIFAVTPPAFPAYVPGDASHAPGHQGTPSHQQPKQSHGRASHGVAQLLGPLGHPVRSAAAAGTRGDLFSHGQYSHSQYSHGQYGTDSKRGYGRSSDNGWFGRH